jgi:CubicO group peptidase (beta-lactamase class C family)
LALEALAVYPDAPSFDDYFEANLGPYVMGYGYAVAKGGEIIANGGGFARSPNENQNPNLPYTADSRMTLASVSKAITGVALEALSLQKGISLDMPFLPLLAGKVSSSDPTIATITLRNLANMQSGLAHYANNGAGPTDLPTGEDIWMLINQHLAQPLAGTPGQTYYYDNTNVTILQAVINLVSGMDYTTYVKQNVLVPAMMNPSVVSPMPVTPPEDATLAYAFAGDMAPGYDWPQFSLVGVSGWVSSARELVKLLAALRGTNVLRRRPCWKCLTITLDGICPETRIQMACRLPTLVASVRTTGRLEA